MWLVEGEKTRGQYYSIIIQLSALLTLLPNTNYAANHRPRYLCSSRSQSRGTTPLTSTAQQRTNFVLDQFQPSMTRFELGRRPVGRRGTIAAAVAFLGLSGFPRQASAFFSAPSCLSATRRGTREVLDVLDVRTCRERPTGAVVSAAARGRMRTRMSTAERELPSNHIAHQTK